MDLEVCVIIIIKHSRSVVPYLNTKNTKDDEESTADEDDVANGFERSDESLHHQLQTWSSANHSKGSTRLRGE